MNSRRLRMPVIAAACVMALSLSSCSSLHPGQAATVGGTEITDEQVNEAALGFCELIAATQSAQPGGQAPSVGMRIATVNAVSQLVLGVAVDRLAREQGVSVSAAEVEQWVEQLPLQLGQLPPEKARDVEETAKRIGRTNLLVERLGEIRFREQNPDQEPPQDPSQYAQLGQQWALEYVRRMDTETDPRFGRVLDEQAENPGTGSLSHPVSDEAQSSVELPSADAQLPEEQTCP